MARQAKGFTLIEVLVVLLIIAIIAAAASLQLGILDSPRQATTALNTIENALPAIRTRAILQPAILGVFFTKSGYNVKRMWLDPKDQSIKWHALKSDHLSNTEAWNSNVKVIWRAKSIITHKSDDDEQDTNNPQQPKIPKHVFIILSNGLVTPGKLIIKWKGKQHATVDITTAGIKQANATIKS